MDIKIITSSKDALEMVLPNKTLAEILRTYLVQDSSVTFAAWKQVHLSEEPILLVKTKGKDAKKAIKDAIAVIDKELASLSSEFSKLK